MPQDPATHDTFQTKKKKQGGDGVTLGRRRESSQRVGSFSTTTVITIGTMVDWVVVVLL